MYALVLLAISSCGKKLTEGKIIDKFYEEPRMYKSIHYDVILKMPRTTTRYDDEDYVFILLGVIDGDTLIERVEVVEDTYSSFEIGDLIKLKKAE